jgi:hypothetical protein
VVLEELSGYGIEPIPANIRHLLVGKIDLGTFDLIYVAGLYDYLRQNSAAKLTCSLFNMLKPNGRLVIGNFLPTLPDIGYMTAYMGWDLIYRDCDELSTLTRLLPAHQVQSVHIVTADHMG